jgi:hypothetical protein
MIRAIQTFYDGFRFRSRTEARFAVMWKALGWRYQYEMDGFVLEQGPFLPDFYLTDCEVFVEVKGLLPSEREIGLCASLADAHDCTVFLAVGQPEHDAAVYRFPPHEDYLISSLRTELESLGAAPDEIERAVMCARSARFEYGEKPVTSTDPRLVNLIAARREHRNLQCAPVRINSAARLPAVSFVTSNSKDGGRS